MMPVAAKKVWDTFASLLSIDALKALKKGLENNDTRLRQGQTTYPSAFSVSDDWPVEAACPIGYGGWQGEQLETVGEVEEFAARMFFEADTKLGEPGGVRHLLNWWDSAANSRQEVFPDLLKEVNLSIEKWYEVNTPPESATA